MELIAVSSIERNPRTIAAEINQIKERTRDAVIDGAIEIGKRLCEAKSMIQAGSWGAWLKENVDYSERTAQNLMAMYNEYGKKGIPDGLLRASMTNALQLIGLPDDMKQELTESGAAESMSSRELEAEIRRLRKEKEEAQLTIDSLLGEQETLKQQKSDLMQTLNAAETGGAKAREAMLAATEKAREAQEENVSLRQDVQALRQRLDEAKRPVEMEPAVVEKVPDEVMKELYELRSLARSNTSANEVLFRDAWSRLVDTYHKCVELAELVAREGGEEKAAKLREALGKALRSMADKM